MSKPFLRLVIDRSRGEYWLHYGVDEILQGKFDGGSLDYNEMIFEGDLSVKNITFEEVKLDEALNNLSELLKNSPINIGDIMNETELKELVETFQYFKVIQELYTRPPGDLTKSNEKKKWWREKNIYLLATGHPEKVKSEFRVQAEAYILNFKNSKVVPPVTVTTAETKTDELPFEPDPPSPTAQAILNQIPKTEIKASEDNPDYKTGFVQGYEPPIWNPGSGNELTTIGACIDGFFIARHDAKENQYIILCMPKPEGFKGVSPYWMFPKKKTAEYCIEKMSENEKLKKFVDGAVVYPVKTLAVTEHYLPAAFIKDVIALLKTYESSQVR